MTMEELIIRNIKTLGIDMIKEAESGSYKPLAIIGIIYLIFLIALISSCSSSPNYL